MFPFNCSHLQLACEYYVTKRSSFKMWSPITSLKKRRRSCITSFVIVFMIYRFIGESNVPSTNTEFSGAVKSLKGYLSKPRLLLHRNPLFRHGYGIRSEQKSPATCAPVILENLNFSSNTWLDGRDLSIPVPKCLALVYNPWFQLDDSVRLKVRKDIRYLDPMYSRKNKAKCCFRNLIFWFPDKSDFRMRLSDCIKWVKPETKFPGDYVTAICITEKFNRVTRKIQTRVLHSDVLLNIPKKPQVEAAVKAAEKSLTENEREDRIKVAIIGLRSVSGFDFRKYLPKTSSFLDVEGAIQFTGFNSIGNGSYDNLIPLLSGKNTEEFHSYCASSPSSTLDGCPFIWKQYKARGFRTAFVEAPVRSHRSVFSQNFQPPFRFTPWDYDLRAVIHKIHSRKYPALHGQCQGDRPTFAILMDHFRKFTTNFRDYRSYYFYFLWHAAMRLGSTASDPATTFVDTTLEATLRDLTKSNVLNNTVVIILSDKGSKSYTSLYPDALQKLPALFFLFPRWFTIKYPAAITRLKNNAASMVTPLDLHRTLDDLSNLLRVSSIFLVAQNASFLDGVQSLFHPVIHNRTCESARIPSSHCLCPKISSAKTVPNTPHYPAIVAHNIVDAINIKIQEFSQCIPHQLKRVIGVKPFSEGGKIFHDNQTLHRIYTLETLPGFGIYEAKISLAKNYTVRNIQSIRRLNAFRFQSYCVDRTRLKPYCYCL